MKIKYLATSVFLLSGMIFGQGQFSGGASGGVLPGIFPTNTIQSGGATGQNQIIFSSDGTVTSSTQTTNHPGYIFGTSSTAAAIRPIIELNNPGFGGGFSYELTLKGGGVSRGGLMWDRQSLGRNDFSIRDSAHSQSSWYVNNGSGGAARYITIGGADAEGTTPAMTLDGNGHVGFTNGVGEFGCTLVAGTCTIAFTPNWTVAPKCFFDGSSAGWMRTASTTANVVVTSSSGTDTAVIAGFCFGFTGGGVVQ